MTVSAGGETPDGGRVDGLARGSAAVLLLADGRELPAAVRRVTGFLIRLDLPPLQAPGTEVELVWSHRGAIRVGAGRVAASGGRHLAVILRGVAAPRQRTLARRAAERDVGVIAAVSGDSLRGAIRGVVRDVSLAGLSFVTAETLHVGDWISIEYAAGRQPAAATGVAPARARVVAVDAEPDGGPFRVRCALDRVSLSRFYQTGRRTACDPD
jgi:hypothetical protein